MRATRLFVPLLAVAAACTTFGKSGDDGADAPVDGGALDDARGGGEPTDGGVGRESGQGPFCEPNGGSGAGSFCDDFEGPQELPRAWSKPPFTHNAELGLKAGADANPSRVLAIGLSGNAGASDFQQGILRLEHGESAIQRSTYRLQFKANVLGASGTIQGPRLVSRVRGVDAGSGNGDRLDVIVAFTSGDVRIAYFNPACNDVSVACGASSGSTPLAISPGWHTYELELVIEPAMEAPYGNVRLVVDGAEARSGVLGFPMFAPKERSTVFGVSQAGPDVTGELLLDDVRIELVDR